MSSRENLPEHLLGLPDEGYGRWGLWRTACVRAAGFPASEVLRMADADCAAAADRLTAVEAEAEGLRQAALEALRGELDGAPKERLDVLVKAIRKVKRQQPAKTEGLAAATAAAIDAWQADAGRVEAEKARYQTAYAAAEEKLEAELREVAQTPRFREAVVWQNRHAAATGLGSFLRRPAGGGRGSARDRGHVQMLAFYLQRYCVKNDTIGFFGPVGWARLGEGEGRISARPGPDVIASRDVFFEGWAIDALADKLAEDPAMRPWLAPMRSPFIRRDGTAYVLPNGQRIELGPLGSALVAACDGTRPAQVLLREMGPVPPDKLPILWGILDQLHQNGLMRWAFQIPLSPFPERTLRELLLQIEDEPLRDRSLAVLDEVVSAREPVVRAAGDPEALERALAGLEETFTRATEKAATRAGGQLYAGRTLVYEDCRRDLDVQVGETLLAEIAPALSLVLASARWFSHCAAQKSRALFVQSYEELREQTGSPQVDALAFTQVSLKRVISMKNNGEIKDELSARWGRVLSIPEGVRRVEYRSEDLRPLVQREFAAPGPGWQKARHHSPDLLIAAPSVEAIRQGDYQVVLGEVHAVMNTLDRWLFFTQHPDDEQLRAAMTADLPEPTLVPVLPKVWNQEQASTGLGLAAPAVTGRMDLALRSPKDYYLEFSLDPSGQPASQILPMAELVVEASEGSVVIGPRDGRIRFDVVDFFNLALLIQALDVFRVVPAGAHHTPRVTIDRLVVARESWSFMVSTLEFAQAATAAERFAAIRRWAAERDLPRFLFVKTPPELKPFYLDLESPALVEIFCKACRKSFEAGEETMISLSEMLPGHGELWLPDAQGNRYSCELRVVAIDGEPVV